MTFLDLQEALIKEIETVLKDMVSKNTDNEDVVGVKGYAHRLPITQSYEGDPAQYFPYFIIRFDSAATKEDTDCWHVVVHIILGFYEMETSNGHEHVLIAIQRIVDRFANDPNFGCFYRADQNLQWAVEDEDTYPFYIGMVRAVISAPKINRREYDDYV